MSSKDDVVHSVVRKDVLVKLNPLRRYGETYNDIIYKLILIDKKYRPISEIFEYVFVTDKTSKVFRLIFNFDDYKLEYYSYDTGYVDDISVWDNFPKISDFEKDLFLKFTQSKDFSSKLYYLTGEYNHDYMFKIRCINRYGI